MCVGRYTCQERRFLLLVLLGWFLSSCAVPAADQNTPPVSPEAQTSASLPSEAVTKAAVLLTSTSLPSPALAFTSTASPVSELDRVSTPAAALGPTETPSPPASPTPTPTFGPRRQTPPTLMLHESTPEFDAVAFLKEFIGLLQAGGFEVITYQQITAQPEITALKQAKLFMITIDDIGLQAEIDPSIQEMIALLREAGYPAVLGVVSAGEAANGNTVATLKELVSLGWEIASHTDTHRNLLLVQQESPGEVYKELITCQDKIEKYLGLRPITLILPEGQMVESARYIRKANLVWAVGIVGGNTYDPTDFVIYVGREGPTLDAATTFRIMLQRFNP